MIQEQRQQLYVGKIPYDFFRQERAKKEVENAKHAYQTPFRQEIEASMAIIRAYTSQYGAAGGSAGPFDVAIGTKWFNDEVSLDEIMKTVPEYTGLVGKAKLSIGGESSRGATMNLYLNVYSTEDGLFEAPYKSDRLNPSFPIETKNNEAFAFIIPMSREKEPRMWVSGKLLNGQQRKMCRMKK